MDDDMIEVVEKHPRSLPCEQPRRRMTKRERVPVIMSDERTCGPTVGGGHDLAARLGR
jgi:hypothetical protein